MNKNYTHTVIQRVAKNLGNTRLMYPRSFTPFRMTMLAAAMALSFSACQNEEPQDAPVAKDALALMPAETPVGVQAELKAESRAAEADANTAYDFTLSIPGGSSSTSFTGSATVATLGNDFPTLQLKDFNLVEGAGRCVSRWTILEAKKDGYETLTGVARLTADANGLPTLSYNLLHTGAKVTVVLTDGTTSFSTIDGIGATLAVKNSKGVWKYGNATLASHLDNVKELNNDPTADDANMKLAIEADETALASIAMTATSDKKFTTVVPATPDGATLADDEVLTITVNTDPDGADGPLITGTYTLKLKDVKVTENGQQKPLTAMKSGEHLTLTVTLAHNMKVSATATIGDWDQVSADVDLNQDPSKIPSYTYDAATHTYTIKFKRGIADVWVDMQQHTDRADAKVMYGIVELKYVNGVAMGVIDGKCGLEVDETGYVSGVTSDDIASCMESVRNQILAATNADITNFYVINELALYGEGAYNAYLGDVIRSLTPSIAPCNTDGSGVEYLDDEISLVFADATSVPGDAFYFCNALRSVSFSKAVTINNNYDWGAFYACSALESVTFTENSSVGNSAFYNCEKLTEVNMEKVTSVGTEAFAYTGLVSVTFDAITSFGEYAFYDCNLTSIAFNQVISDDDVIQQSAFNGITTTDCDLTLASGQEHLSSGTPNGTAVTAADANATEADRTWAGYVWKSITISNNQ